MLNPLYLSSLIGSEKSCRIHPRVLLPPPSSEESIHILYMLGVVKLRHSKAEVEGYDIDSSLHWANLLLTAPAAIPSCRGWLLYIA